MLVREEFVGVARNAFAGTGFDHDAALVPFPVDLFLVGSDIEPVRDRVDDFIAGLTTWVPRATTLGISEAGRLEIEAETYERAYDRMNLQFMTNTWGDGLPLNPPTPERVDWVLLGTDRHRSEVIGKVLPLGHIATVETLAISLAMAGGRPEYLPVLIAAVEAILDPQVNHQNVQATSASTFPVIIVNGPIARQIRLNSGFGLLGPDPQHPAGATIGRALRLILQNVGGALPGVGTMAMFGAMRYTNAVFAEDEEGLPQGWSPVCQDRAGFPLGTNAVTAYFATGATNIIRRGQGKEGPDEEAEQSLERVAGYLRVPNIHYARGWANGTPGALLISSVVAKQLVARGWTKESIKRFIWEKSRVAGSVVTETGVRQWIGHAGGDMDPWPITRTAEQIILCVAGGNHPTHNFWMQAYAPKVAAREIGLPAAWDELVTKGDEDFGCGDACVI